MPHKDPEARKIYKQSESYKKSVRISGWKRQGIIVEDWDTFHDYFLSVTHCQMCKKELTTGKRTHATRCADHDHNITDRPNVRYICCLSCNANDQSTNTSGEPNIFYIKREKRWMFKKTIQGKRHISPNFKTKEEAINYKRDFLASPIFG